MNCSELDFTYPEELVGLEPRGSFRALWSGSSQGLRELLHREELFALFRSGDVLVVNDTKVVKRRVFSSKGLEVLFVNPLSDLEWEVLLPLRRWKSKGNFKGNTRRSTYESSHSSSHRSAQGGTPGSHEGSFQQSCLTENLTESPKLELPQGIQLRLLEGGLPQKVILNKPIDDKYFESFGEFALPPYIQKSRGQRHMRSEDEKWYQTAWAETMGSCASPTASLHFSKGDLDILKSKGVVVVFTTLHVGLGTFLPIHENLLDDHKMHSEWAELSRATIRACENCRGRIWALGSTVMRSLESYGAGLLEEQGDGRFTGRTDLFIRPGFSFKYVDILMTNFHQPRSTLLSMVYAFAGVERTRKVYQWAIDSKFRLFSYGDLSVWEK